MPGACLIAPLEVPFSPCVLQFDGLPGAIVEGDCPRLVCTAGVNPDVERLGQDTQFEGATRHSSFGNGVRHDSPFSRS